MTIDENTQIKRISEYPEVANPEPDPSISGKFLFETIGGAFRNIKWSSMLLRLKEWLSDFTKVAGVATGLNTDEIQDVSEWNDPDDPVEDPNQSLTTTLDEISMLINSLAIITLDTGITEETDGFTLTGNLPAELIIGAINEAYFELETDVESKIVGFDELIVDLTTVPYLQGLADGQHIVFTAYDIDGVVYYSDEDFTLERDRLQLGLMYILKIGPTIEFIDFTLSALSKPNLANTTHLTRQGFRLERIDMAITTSGLQFGHKKGLIYGETINWADKTAINLYSKLETPVAQFRYFDGGTAFITEVPPISDTLDPLQYWDGGALVPVGNNNASVQRIMFTIRGTFVVQYGEVEYGTITEAKNNLFIAPFTGIFPTGYAVEYARIAFTDDAISIEETLKAQVVLL